MERPLEDEAKASPKGKPQLRFAVEPLAAVWWETGLFLIGAGSHFIIDKLESVTHANCG